MIKGMQERVVVIADKIIFLGYAAVFFVTPLIVVPITSELFEFNKMFFVYGVTVVIAGSWIIGGFRVRRTPLDLVIILFLISQIAATVFSIDPHVSIWGYYSRQNGGLLSTIAYIILYYGFVSNFKGNLRVVKGLLRVALGSGLLVAGYGVAQHFGVDRGLWVQDVQRRVFSTLGQPNWLAAYLAVLSMIALGLGVGSLSPLSNLRGRQAGQEKVRVFSVLKEYWWVGVVAVFYLVILYTRSRSGLLGFWVGDAVFWLGTLGILGKGKVKGKIKSLGGVFVGLHLGLVVLTVVVGAPGIGEVYNRGSPSASSGQATGTWEIRKHVWRGAVNAFRANPVLGTGVETFAWAFYLYKPVEHNATSEWDFLYNKAHNEYLNFAATTGILGLGSYLLLIGFFGVWVFREFREFRGDKTDRTYMFGLFAAWVSILVTNFFGFSTVVTSLYFWLVPAVVFSLGEERASKGFFKGRVKGKVKGLAGGVVVLGAGYLLFTLGRYWYADVVFARGGKLVRADFVNKGEEDLRRVARLRPGEPNFWDELGYAQGLLAVEAGERGEATRAAELVEESLTSQGRALRISPHNLSFVKTRVRLYYLFAQIFGEADRETKDEDASFLDLAIETLEIGREMAPRDPKILYNLALLYASRGDQGDQGKDKGKDQGKSGGSGIESAINALEGALELRADYPEAREMLELLREEEND